MQNYQFDYVQYKKKINKKSVCLIPILLILNFILLVVAFYLTTSSNEQEFYFVQIDEFATYKDANTLACEIQGKNAGGYIYYDGTYHVLASFYLLKDDAESVSTNLKNDYPNACVFSISTPKKIYATSLSNKQHACANEFCLNSLSAIQQLADLSIKYDCSEISFSELSVKIKDLSSSLRKSKDNLSAELSSPKYALAIKHAEEIAICLEELEETTEQEMSKQIKYELIKLVINYSSFLSAF